MDKGTERLASFAKAPKHVQEAFWQEVRAEVERERDFKRWLLEQDTDGPPPVPPEERLKPPVVWGERWEHRAERARQSRRYRLKGSIDRVEALRSFDPPIYVSKLTGVDIEYERKIPCPLPNHEDRTPSFRAYATADRGWYCWGCNRGGDIFNFAKILWHEPHFPYLVEALAERFGLAS